MEKKRKIEKLKKILIILGGVLNILACCFLVGIILLLIFNIEGKILKAFLLFTMAFFDLGIMSYLIALIVKILTKEDVKLSYETSMLNKLWEDYKNDQLPIDVWRVLEYYYKVINGGHIEFFEGLEFVKLQETVDVLIKILPLEFSSNLEKAYNEYKQKISLLKNNSNHVKELVGNFYIYDEFFKENKQKYENYVKRYVGLMDNNER